MARDVLLIGLDPKRVPGVDAKLVETAIAMGQARFDQAGIPTETLLLDLREPTKQRIIDMLDRRPFRVVVIGGGIRKPDEQIELFETVVDLVRRHAPQAAIAFNSNPMTSFDAARRWLPG